MQLALQQSGAAAIGAFGWRRKRAEDVDHVSGGTTPAG